LGPVRKDVEVCENVAVVYIVGGSTTSFDRAPPRFSPARPYA